MREALRFTHARCSLQQISALRKERKRTMYERLTDAMRLELRGIKPAGQSAFAIAAKHLGAPAPCNRRQRERILESWEAQYP